jgi:hypothetical protein
MSFSSPQSPRPRPVPVGAYPRVPQPAVFGRPGFGPVPAQTVNPGGPMISATQPRVPQPVAMRPLPGRIPSGSPVAMRLAQLLAASRSGRQ